MGDGRIIKTSIIQRQRTTGGNTEGRRNGKCTGLTFGGTGRRFRARGARVRRGCWGRIMQGPKGPKDEPQSPLSRGGTSNWKKGPSSCCSKARGEKVVPGIMGVAVGSPGWSWNFYGNPLVSPLHREQTCFWLLQSLRET